MKRMRSLLVVLSALIVSACRGGDVRSSANLPTDGARLLLQKEGLFVISAENGTTTQWQPRTAGNLDIWAASAADYHHFVHDNAIIFIGNTGDYAKFALGETSSTRLSPDGRYAGRLLDGNAVLWRIDQQPTDAQTIAENVAVTGGWTRDGTQLIYQRVEDGVRQHFLYDVASGQQTLFAESEGNIRFPIWSDDGAFYSFVTIEDGLTQLHQISAENQQTISVTLPFSEPTKLFYVAQTNSLIAASRDDMRGQLHHIDPTNGSVKRLIETPYFIKETVVTPDGSSLFAVVDNWNTTDTLQLHNLSLSDAPDVSATLNAASIAATAFSPVGNKLALLVDGSRLLVWDGVAAAPLPLIPSNDSTTQPINISSFVWSADGESLFVMAAFEDDCQSKKKFSIALVPTFVDELSCALGLYRVQADGNGYERLGTFRSPMSASMESTLVWLP